MEFFAPGQGQEREQLAVTGHFPHVKPFGTVMHQFCPEHLFLRQMAFSTAVYL